MKEDFKASTTKFPDCVECYALYAKVLQETQDLEGADALYKKGVELNPANANLLVHRALLALQKTKDVNAAQEATEAALKVDEKCEFAWETLGQIQIQKDNMDEAVKAFDKVTWNQKVIQNNTNHAGNTTGEYGAWDGTSVWFVGVSEGKICSSKETGRATNWNARHGAGLVGWNSQSVGIL